MKPLCTNRRAVEILDFIEDELNEKYIQLLKLPITKSIKIY